MVTMLGDSDACVVLHSFSSGPEVLRAGLDKGYYISFSGMVTFRNWEDVAAVRAVPSDRLLVETDAPYLAPVPHRGKRNEPAFVAQVAARVAQLRGETAEQVALQTTANATRCFGPRIALQPD
jgi:TatD DNase family protein